MLATGGTPIEAGAAATPLESWTLAPDAIRTWAETAHPGTALVYARGWLSARSGAAVLARRLRARGLVTFVQKSVPGGKLYLMQRLSASPIPLGKPRKAKAPQMDGDMARVLRVLRLCARHQRVCPCNRDLGREAGVRNASYAIQKLVDAKIIESRILDRVKGTRLISIIATEQRTALPEGWLG